MLLEGFGRSELGFGFLTVFLVPFYKVCLRVCSCCVSLVFLRLCHVCCGFWTLKWVFLERVSTAHSKNLAFAVILGAPFALSFCDWAFLKHVGCYSLGVAAVYKLEVTW